MVLPVNRCASVFCQNPSIMCYPLWSGVLFMSAFGAPRALLLPWVVSSLRVSSLLGRETYSSRRWGHYHTLLLCCYLICPVFRHLISSLTLLAWHSSYDLSSPGSLYLGLDSTVWGLTSKWTGFSEAMPSPQIQCYWRCLFIIVLARRESSFPNDWNISFILILDNLFWGWSQERGGVKDAQWYPERLFLTGGYPYDEPVCCDDRLSSKGSHSVPLKLATV
jgi:hypothetical protein